MSLFIFASFAYRLFLFSFWRGGTYAFAGGLAQAFAAGSLAQAFTAPHAFAGGLAQALVLPLSFAGGLKPSQSFLK
jgi:hypothetical protein